MMYCVLLMFLYTFSRIFNVYSQTCNIYAYYVLEHLVAFTLLRAITEIILGSPGGAGVSRPNGVVVKLLAYVDISISS